MNSYTPPVDEESRMFELLEAGEQQDELMFSVDRNDLDEKVVRKMVTLGLLENVTVMYGGRVVKLTAQGLRALAQARAAGSKTLNWSQEARPVQFHQIVHGTANTQVGDRNVMHVHVQGTPPDQFLHQLTELRALVNTLPDEDRDEAVKTIDSAESAAKKGLLERVQTYGPVLLTLGTGTVEFVKKVKEVFGL